MDVGNQQRPDEIPLPIIPVFKVEEDSIISFRFIKRVIQNQQNETTQLCSTHRLKRFVINIITWLLNFGPKTKISDFQSYFIAHRRRLNKTLAYKSRVFPDKKVPVYIREVYQGQYR